ncbi:MAG: autotransporter domain-containing protein, partial [Xanthomonadaceae bacterium]|nr:autotransporter domain-containing protein [Xanthomonadaceae bacterium]
SGGMLSGTPSVSGSFTFGVTATDSSTGAGAPFTATRSYTLQVNAPGIALSPASLPNPQVGAAYSQQFVASGGDGSYVFAVTAGSLPNGLSLSASGLLAGTPATAAGFSFTVTATDSLHFSGSQAYTVNVAQPRPVAVDDTASTPANAAVTVAVTANDSGPIASIAIVHAPAHGTASVSGLDVVYTPASNYFGGDTLTYAATGPGGTSAAATVSITVTPLAAPTAMAQTASVLAGKPVTIDATAGATGGPFTAVAVVAPPGTGTLAINGTDMVFTPAATASGNVVFSYSLSNAFGASAPATVTVTVNPLPVAASRSANAIAGVPLQVDLTGGASGGPFTAATLVSMAPANLGTASITPAAGGYQLNFTPNASASGAVVVSFTLANAYATSTAGTITISIAPRSDPSKDAEVLGLLGAQTEAMRRFASGQINNFQQRLDALHGDGTGGGEFDNGISLVPSFTGQPGYGLAGNDRNRPAGPDANWRYLVDPAPAVAAPGTVVPGLPSNMAVWTQGAISFGTRDPRAGSGSSGFDFHTSGLTAGADYRLSRSFAFGGGIGYGHDNSSVGHSGSRSKADSYSLAFYASFQPGAAAYIDGLAGYQTISFDSHRFVTESGGYLDGHRHAGQFFASLSGGYDYRHGRFQLNPYGRLDSASGALDGYTEKGGSPYALSYRRETVNTTTGSFGLRIDYRDDVSMGMLVPQLRLEYQHDFQGASSASLGYADLLSGPLPRANVAGLNQNRMLLGLGAGLQTWKGLSLRFEYQRQFGTSGETDQSLLLDLQKRF